MPAQSEPNSRPDRIRDLIRKLQALMADAAASEGERSNARAKLRCIMERHGLTDADLLSDVLRPVTLIYDHKDDLAILLQVAGEVLGVTAINFKIVSTLRELRISIEVTAADSADLMEAWSHYRPIVSIARQAATKRQRALRKEATAIGKGFGSAFIQKHRIFPPNDPRPQPKLTKGAFRRMMDAYAAEDAIRDAAGDKWKRKAGHIETSQPLQLT